MRSLVSAAFGLFCLLVAPPLAASPSSNAGAVPPAAASAPVSLDKALRPGRIVYGPFRVIDEERVALIGITDSRSPDQFARLLRDYPRMRVLVMVDCPGTDDDIANFRLGRMIRQQNMATVVPTGGSVRSGAVELFIAGARRYADRGSEFAVHSWIDETGREPDNFSPNAPENRRYIDFYDQMGMTSQEAQSFYAMTNSVPFASARWLGAMEMGSWVQLNKVIRRIPSVTELRSMTALRVSPPVLASKASRP